MRRTRKPSRVEFGQVGVITWEIGVGPVSRDGMAPDLARLNSGPSPLFSALVQQGVGSVIWRNGPAEPWPPTGFGTMTCRQPFRGGGGLAMCCWSSALCDCSAGSRDPPAADQAGHHLLAQEHGRGSNSYARSRNPQELFPHLEAPHVEARSRTGPASRAPDRRWSWKLRCAIPNGDAGGGRTVLARRDGYAPTRNWTPRTGRRNWCKCCGCYSTRNLCWLPAEMQPLLMFEPDSWHLRRRRSRP